MRLRLCVRRHGIPDANILWSSDGLHAIPQGNASQPTIAQFLLQVNEVVPLESEDWGLEDYVLEVGGFECVHFSALDSVLKEDDQVLIRPLELNDRRFRRVSGRIQIAADGRRLYDGVAFGRPFLRKSHRPAVRIPSIKRARITYDSEDDETQRTTQSTQLVLRDDDTDEDDFGYDEELSLEEIADLAAENVRFEQSNPRSLQHNRSFYRDPPQGTGLGIGAVGISPSAAVNSSSSGLQSRRPPGQLTIRKSVGESPKSVRFYTDEVDTPATILAMDETDDEDDEDYNFDEGESNDSEANKENVAPSRALRSAVVDVASEASTEAESDSSESTSSSDSESSSSDELESSDDDSERHNGSMHSDSSDHSSSSDESSSESGSQNVSSLKARSDQSKTGLQKATKATTHQVAEQKTESQTMTPPGQGSKATQRRNLRRKLRKQFERAEAIAPRLESMTTKKRIISTQHDVVTADGTAGALNDLEKRKALLLEALIPTQDSEIIRPSEDVDMTLSTKQQESFESSVPPEEQSSRAQVHVLEEVVQHQTNQPVQQMLAGQIDYNNDSPKSLEAESKQSSSRRSKLDLGSAKRMLFGSLGLRAPKSKDDADKLKNQLETKASKLPGNIIGPVKPPELVTSPPPVAVNEDWQHWEDVIDLKAVECCYDGVEYTAPPFPFVQRWDPQQQYSNKRKGKGGVGRSKRQKRNQAQYYQSYEQEEDQDYSYYDDSFVQQIDHDYADNTAVLPDKSILDTKIQSEQDLEAANNQLLAETEIAANTVVEGLEFPDLPADMSAVPMLSPETAIAGNIIAFKQMEMSEQTGWSPVISDYRTAKIQNVLDDDILAVHLASRDIIQKERHYDPETGERLYSKFEMPDEDNEEEGDLAHGYLEIGFQDMIDARLLYQLPIDEAYVNEPASIGISEKRIEKLFDVGKQLVGNTPPSVELGAESESELQGPNSFLASPADSAGLEEKDGIDNDGYDTVQSKSLPSKQRGMKSLVSREPSIELGSHESPMRSSPPRARIPVSPSPDETRPGILIDRQDAAIHIATVQANATCSLDGAAEDPSLWHLASSAKDDEETRFFSPLTADTRQRSSASHCVSSDRLPVEDQSSPTEQLDSPADFPKHFPEGLRETVKTDRPEEVLGQFLEEQEDDALEEQEVESLYELEDDAVKGQEDEADKTLTQDTTYRTSSRKTSQATEPHDTLPDHDSDDASGSSSLMSLKDLLSQPMRDSVSPPKISVTRKRKTSGYPKIAPIQPETDDAFVFSQAPTRLVSDTHKIALGPDEGHFASDEISSDDHIIVDVYPEVDGPHELDAHPNKPTPSELPAPSPSGLLKAQARTSSPSIWDPAEPIDLTLTSDLSADVEEEVGIGIAGRSKQKRSARRVASTRNSMPAGRGWVGKGAVKESNATGKGGRSSKRNVKRTKSLV